MKRRLPLIAVILFATACTETLVYTARYDIGLSNVERHQRGGEVKRFADVHGHAFEDEFIKVTWSPFETQLGLILKNKMDSPQRVVWDHVRYVGPDGKPDRVIHEGVKIEDLGRFRSNGAKGPIFPYDLNPDASMPPTVVVGGGTLLDLIEPTGHIYWSTITLSPGLNHKALIGYESETTERKVRSKMVHGTIKVLLPIEMDGTIREYLFQFSITGDVVVTGWAS